MTSAERRLFVELDNAMGSRRGDVDDGFALAAMLMHGPQPLAVGSTFGNTSEPDADHNNRTLTRQLHAQVRHVRGCGRPGQDHAEGVDFLTAQREPFTVLALGPLTTVAAALRLRSDLPIARLIVVGGDATSRGRWPPLWPYEFNLRCDRQAAVTAFESRVPITVVPLDVGRRALLSRTRLETLRGPFGDYARQHARRWYLRARRRFRRDAIRVYDLLAVACALRSAVLTFAERNVTMHRRGWLEFGPSSRSAGRPVRVVTDFDDGLFELLQPSTGTASGKATVETTTTP